MFQQRHLIRALIVGLACSAGAARATTFSYALTGAPSSAVLFFDTNSFGSYTVGTIPLTNTATGLPSIPGFTVAAGDVVLATVTLSSVFTMPASRAFADIDVLLASNFSGQINYSAVLTFFMQGLVVQPFSGQGGFAPFSGSGGSFAIGGVAAQLPTPSFIFDTMTVQATITGFTPSVASMSLPTSAPRLEFITYAPVPEPASAMLMLSGLAALLGAARRRRQAWLHT